MIATAPAAHREMSAAGWYIADPETGLWRPHRPSDGNTDGSPRGGIIPIAPFISVRPPPTRTQLHATARASPSTLRTSMHIDGRGAQAKLNKSKVARAPRDWSNVSSTQLAGKTFGFWVTSAQRRNWIWAQQLSELDDYIVSQGTSRAVSR